MPLLRYDVITAPKDIHPQANMIHLGFKVLRSEPILIADAWVFEVEDNQIPLPNFLKIQDKFTFTE